MTRFDPYDDPSLPVRLALAPNGAFRGLVFEHAIGVVFAPEGGFVSTPRAVGSLVGWTLLGAVAAVGTLAYGDRVDAAVERVRRGFGE